MTGITPRTKTGGQDEWEAKLAAAMALLGKAIGIGLFGVVVVILTLELLLNPIFLFAQAHENGVEIGNPLTSLGWWSVTIVTFATTGVQYALFDENSKNGTLGVKIAWTIAVMDTFMDGGGIAAWLIGVVHGEYFSPDTSALLFGMFPSTESPWWVWVSYVTVAAICFVHEKFLRLFLGRESFKAAPDAPQMTVNIAAWIHRAGNWFNAFRFFAIASAPVILLGLDMLLFTQSVRGTNFVVSALFLFFTIMVTLVTMMAWEYYAHLRDRGYQVQKLDQTHRVAFAVALLGVFGDSLGDLSGFNNLIFGEATLWPTQLDMVGPFVLTAGLVILMTSMFEPMFTDVFSQVGKLVDQIPTFGGEPG